MKYFMLSLGRYNKQWYFVRAEQREDVVTACTSKKWDPKWVVISDELEMAPLSSIPEAPEHLQAKEVSQ